MGLRLRIVRVRVDLFHDPLRFCLDWWFLERSDSRVKRKRNVIVEVVDVWMCGLIWLYIISLPPSISSIYHSKMILLCWCISYVNNIRIIFLLYPYLGYLLLTIVFFLYISIHSSHFSTILIWVIYIYSIWLFFSMSKKHKCQNMSLIWVS